MVFMQGSDWQREGTRISLELQTRGWPPCALQYYHKLVCISLTFRAPCKFEFFFFTKDSKSRTISNDHIHYPLQAWGGQMPLDVVYPFTMCRLGAAWRLVKCPAKPLELLHHWNTEEGTGAGEYVRNGRAAMEYSPGTERLPEDDWCLALPVMTQDRDTGDTRNQRLLAEGLNSEDLRLLGGYARSLHRGGYASFAAHLQDAPCQRRQNRILQGDQFVGLSDGRVGVSLQHLHPLEMLETQNRP
ncbi:unnamed protein product [Symbiodinium pilosum]|uniref:Uncharacterized protein n=1 Tax=Symbiodinium pilosum TaxID=2952 RepID=A0A812XPV9_SYMPI|nr:unnamed protein product [Symbiodinium pilosum]